MSTHSKDSSHHALGTFLLALLLVLAAMLLMGQSALTAEDDPVDGKEIFESVCITCHTVQPPANLAPPMAMIVRHYRMALTDSAAVREALISWIGSPDSSKSLLPAHAIERFGLMAPLPLTPEAVAAVADYVMTLDAEMPSGGMSGMMGSDNGGRMGMGGMNGGDNGGRMGMGMMRMDSTAAGMQCPSTDSTAATMTCPRSDSTAAMQKCPRMEGMQAHRCGMNH